MTHDELLAVIASGGDLTGVDLRRVNLRKADMTQVNLTRADLTHTILTDANLAGANLTDANLTRAKLDCAILSGAKLTGANLTDANLTGADMADATLNGANLRNVDLTRAKLTDTILTRADLTHTTLNGANLTRAILTGADLTGAALSEANLTGAIGLPEAPVVQNIDAAILAAIAAGEVLDMEYWHAPRTCGTTHCRAGLAVILAGDAGRKLELELGTNAAAALIYNVSRPGVPVPDWFASKDETMADMEKWAGITKFLAQM